MYILRLSNTAAEHEIKLQMNTRNMCDILCCTSLYKLDSGVPLSLFKFMNSLISNLET